MIQKIVNFDPILHGKMGSHSYGTNTPESDMDTMGIVVPDVRNFYFGLKDFGDSGTFDVKNDIEDTHFYELKKFMRLATNFNPNVIPLLWLRPEDYIAITNQGRKLIANRNIFNSRKAYTTLCGYAHAQRSRMHGTNTSQLGDKRKKLVELYGFDTKFAFHTIRLLRMCEEFLLTKHIQVWRPDREELYSIREGKFSLEQIEGMIEDLLQRCSKALEVTTLPKEPDYDAINNLTIEILEDIYKT